MTSVKLSVRVDMPDYQRLQVWLAKQLPVTGQKVDTTSIGAALFAELLADPDLADRVLDRVREQREQRKQMRE